MSLSQTCQKLSPLTKQSNLWALSSIRAVTVCLFMMGRLTSSFVPQCCRCSQKTKVRNVLAEFDRVLSEDGGFLDINGKVNLLFTQTLYLKTHIHTWGESK